MSRVLRIELRRSVAPSLMVAVALIGVIILYAGLQGSITWAGNWMKLATMLRDALLLLAALAVGAGAWQGRREHQVAELLASTARPRRQRILPIATALGAASAAGYLMAFAAGATWVARTASYANPGAIAAVVIVGALAMLAAVWLGLVAGHLMPSKLTAPILTIVAVMVMALVPEFFNRGQHPQGPALALLLPGLDVSYQATDTVAGRVSAIQLLWLLAVAGTAIGMLAATHRRGRLLALLPVALTAVMVVPLLPHGSSGSAYATDAQAAQPVCTIAGPRVCVTRVKAHLLPQVTGPARQALTKLARLPGAPTTVIEQIRDEYYNFPPPRADRVWMELPNPDGAQGLLAGQDVRDLEAALLDSALRNDGCRAPAKRQRRDDSARAVGVAWLLGRPPTPMASDDADEMKTQALIRSGWRALTSLPASTQRERVSAMRRAVLTCDGDPYDILTNGDRP